MEFFNIAFDNLIERIANDYGIPKDELMKLKIHTDRVQCSGLTAKNIPCKNICVSGNLCHLHTRERLHVRDQDPVVKKLPKTKKKKIIKEQPIHNHAPGMKPIGVCKLCATHGNVLNKNLPFVVFINDENIKERLKL